MPSGSPEREKLTPWQRFLADSAYIREFIRKYRRYFTVGLLALLVVDACEVLPPYFLKEAVDIATGDKPLSLLGWIVAGYLGASVAQAAGRYGWRMCLTRASMLAGRDLRSRFAHHVFGLSQSFFDRRPIGDLMSLATSDVEAVRMVLGSGLLTLADAAFYFMTVPIVMYLLSPKLTLLAFLPLPVIPWLVLRNEREIHKRYEKVQEQFSLLSAMTQESLNGVRVLKAFAKEDAQAERFRKEGERFAGLSLYLARVQSSFGPTLDFTMSVGLVLLLFVGGHDIIRGGSAAGAVTLGTFVAFQRYIQKMVWPMAALGMALSSYQRAISSAARLDDVYRCRTDVPDPPEIRLAACAAGAKTPGRIELRGLSFRFPGSDREVLHEVSLVIEPGERIALMGTIGSGKSALLSLLPRLYPVSRGMLLIDGMDVNDWPVRELRRQIGYVSQDLFLFSETVLENLAYGIAGWSAEPQDIAHIEATTRLASVHEDVLSLTGAYQTRVGERGVNLSGGQKQRLTIARAIAKRPSILVLDDALSSVDVQTEERILSGLRQRPGRNTEIIAAHRISTIRDADRIVVFDGGHIRQVGTHRELVADRRGLYRKFHDQQRLKEELESYSESLEPTDARTDAEVSS